MAIFVFIDALGWEVLSRHPRFLEGLAPVRTPVDTVLGYSCACDPTILTGVMPRDHGHFSFFRYDPDRSPFGHTRWLGLLPPAIRERGRVRRWLSKGIGALLGYDGYFALYGVPFEHLPFLDYTEKKDLYEPGGINHGCETVFDRFRSTGVRFHRSDWRRPEEENVRRARESLTDGPPRAIYLYLAGLDQVMHARGTEAGEVSEALERYDLWLRALVDDISDRGWTPRLHVFSDHGMTDVRGTSDLRCRVESLGLRYGHDYAAVYDSTMARFWFPEASAREPILSLLADEEHGRILDSDTLGRLGCDFENSEYGETIFLLDPGYVFDPSFMGPWVPRGMHGYDPSHPDSRAAYLTSHPGARLPRHLTDLFELILTESGVRA